MTKTVSWAVAGPTRTLAQATPSWIIVEFIDAWAYDMDERQFGVSVLLLTMIIGFFQGLIENKMGKAILREVPPTEVPVVDDNRPDDDTLI